MYRFEWMAGDCPGMQAYVAFSGVNSVLHCIVVPGNGQFVY